MKIEPDIKLDYSDVLIRPKRSSLNSRNDVSILRDYTFPHTGRTWNGVPIMVANMDTVGTFEMAEALFNAEERRSPMITTLHKFYQPDEIVKFYERMYDTYDTNVLDYAWLSTGIRNNEPWLSHITKHIDIPHLVVDIANGYSSNLMEFCRKMRERMPKTTIVAGNVVTREMVEEYILNGIDIVKVGIGPGSVCTTRIQTGVGYPQLSAVMECADAAHGVGGMIIADGGITCPGDISKAFGAGADFVMCGGLFSGHDETTGNVVEEGGQLYKEFYGMSSETAMKKHFGQVAKYRSSEGKRVLVPYKGSVHYTIQSILGGLRSTMTYVGAHRLKDLGKCTTFIRVNHQVNTIYGKTP